MGEHLDTSMIIIIVLVILLIVMLIRMLKQEREFSKERSVSKDIKKDKEVLLGNIDEFVKEKENESDIVKLEQEIAVEPEVEQKGYHGPLNVYRGVMPDAEGVDKSSFVDFSSFSLLIVEDNLINQKILLGVLRDSGMRIDVANNGQEALDFLFEEKREYDIVLMDISMPVMDGETCTKNIRENEAFNTLPIVAFTAFAIGPEIESMFDVGVNGYMTKPLNVKKLYTVFTRFLKEA